MCIIVSVLNYCVDNYYVLKHKMVKIKLEQSG